MKTKKQILLSISILGMLLTFLAFKNNNQDYVNKSIIMMKVYTCNDNDYNGAIIIWRGEGKTTRIPLLMHKAKNYVENDAKIATNLNELISSGKKLIQQTSSSDANGNNTTTYIFEN